MSETGMLLHQLGLLLKGGRMTQLGAYRGTVQIHVGGLWVLQDSEPVGWGYDHYPSDFAARTGDEGIYLISGRYASPVDVEVQVHDGRPEQPAGWGKSAEVEGTYPSRVARAWCEVLEVDEGLDHIQLPAQRVRVRVLVNGWSTPPNPEGAPETWLLQVWPAAAD